MQNSPVQTENAVGGLLSRILLLGFQANPEAGFSQGHRHTPGHPAGGHSAGHDEGIEYKDRHFSRKKCESVFTGHPKVKDCYLITTGVLKTKIPALVVITKDDEIDEQLLSAELLRMAGRNQDTKGIATFYRYPKALPKKDKSAARKHMESWAGKHEPMPTLFY